MRKTNLIVAFVMLSGLAQAALAAGGMSGDHMSAGGQTNNNAQSSPDATRGLDRAQERMSEQGATHEQAMAQKKAQGKTKATVRKAKKVETTADTK